MGGNYVENLQKEYESAIEFHKEQIETHKVYLAFHTEALEKLKTGFIMIEEIQTGLDGIVTELTRRNK